MQYSYYIPTKILFGRGQLNNLHKEKLPGNKALIVISNGKSVKKYGYLAKLEEQLDKSKVSYILFDKILPNPTKEHVMEAAKISRDNKCNFIIGLGGGSALDSAKAIAMMSTNDGDLWDYFNGGTAKGKKMKKNPLPMVAITTTAGTGTEADPWLVITNTETNEKIGFGCEKTFPVLSVVDSELMMTVPEKLTAYQGFDALFHSVEGYLNINASPISDTFALRSIELITKYLDTAVNEGNNIIARENIALANTLAGIVESLSSCISQHALEHALSGFHPELPHGAGLIMLSEAYFSHFAKSGVCNQKMIDMAKAMGIKNPDEPMDFVKALANLQRSCGVDNLKMSDYGIDKTDLRKYAKKAYDIMPGLFAGDPRPLTEDESTEILERSYR